MVNLVLSSPQNNGQVSKIHHEDIYTVVSKLNPQMYHGLSSALHSFYGHHACHNYSVLSTYADYFHPNPYLDWLN